MRALFIMILLLCALLSAESAGQPDPDNTLQIGVLAFRSKEATLQRWQPTADYLSSHCTNFEFEILPLNYPELEQAVASQSIDFVLTNSGHYVALEADFGVTRLATLVKLVQEIPSSVFGGVIFCRADRQDLNSFADLKNHSFKAVGQFSLGGYLAARMELLEAGIDITKDFSELSFTGMPHDQIVMAVLAGEVDAGTMRTSVLENMASEGTINLSDLKILGVKRDNQFPFLHSTDLYPEWPISSMPHISSQLRRAVAKILLEIPDDDKAALVGLYHQWTIPSNYQTVHNMMRRLRMGPYEKAGQFNRMDVMTRYHFEFLILAFVVALVLSSSALRLFHLNRKLVSEMAERKIIESERVKIKAELHRSQKMEAIGVLAGGVAHDLNNILTGLVSYPEMILMDLPKGSPLRSDIQTVMDMGERASAVVADLLTVSRAVVAIPDILNVRNEIHSYRQSSEFAKLQQSFPHIVFHWKLDDCQNSICCSQSHFRSTLMNLVINATESILGTGKVVISSRDLELSKAVIGFEKILPDKYVVVSVEDTGPGIPAQNIEQIFEPFFTRKVLGKSGTGLGLAIVWNTMHNHHGFIDLESNENGSRFDLYFQVVSSNDAADTEDIKLEELKGHGERILVVDDEQIQRDISCRMLNELGYEAISVASGEEAINHLPKNPVDMAILDMIMDPGINGLQTLKELKRIDPHLKAMIASGYAKNEAIDTMMGMGAKNFIYKPYNLQQLALAVSRTLSDARMLKTSRGELPYSRS